MKQFVSFFRSNSKLLTIILFSLTAIFIIAFKLFSFYSCQKYSCLVIPGEKQWREKEVYENNKTSWRGLLQHPEYTVRLAVSSKVKLDEAQQYTKVKLMQLKGSFEEAGSPYPGPISDKVTCQEKYIPQIKEIKTPEGIKISTFTEYLDNRLHYGSCLEDQIEYKGYGAIFYCPDTKQWFQLELIAGKNDTQNEDLYFNLFQNLKCQRPSVKIGRLLP